MVNEEEKSIEILAEAEQNQVGKSLLLKERFEINFDKPLPELNINGAKAYNVKDRIDARKSLFALICGKETAPRSSLFSYIKSIDHSNLMKLLEYGTINDPTTNSHEVALIYAKPQGGSLLDNLEELDYKNKPQLFKEHLQQILSAIESLKRYNLSHRSIRLNNKIGRAHV